MPNSFDSERREYVRIKNELIVRYKFISATITDSRLDEIYTGTATNISAGGIMISGVIPNAFWIPELLMQRIVIGLNFLLPQEAEPVKTLTRVAWVETIDENTHLCLLGLKFKEITTKDADKIFKFVIHNQLPS